MTDIRYDQHFLINKSIAKKIVSLLDFKEKDVLVEIGPGKGALTREIPKKGKIIIIEKDTSLINELKLIDGIESMTGDGIQEIKKIKFNKLLTNTPYSIIEPLFRELFFKNFDLAVIVVSEGFYKNLNKDNLLGFLSNHFFNVVSSFIIPKKDFFPKPKTDSIVLTITKKEENFVQKIYKQKTKYLGNALRDYFTDIEKLTKKQAKEKISSLYSDFKTLDKTVVRLSLTDWKYLNEKIKLRLTFNK